MPARAPAGCCPGAAWDLVNAELFGLHANVYLGELALVGAAIAPLLRDADVRGNLYMLASLRSGPTHLHWLAQNDVAAARRRDTRAAVAHLAEAAAGSGPAPTLLGRSKHR